MHKLADTLVVDPAQLFERISGGAPLVDTAAARSAVLDTIRSRLSAAAFPPTHGPSSIIIPFTFD